MFRFKLQPIPETREEFNPNELPICQRDIRQLAQIDERLAENARYATQIIRLHGFVNSNTVDFVFPQGIKGPIDESALGRVILNLATWSDIDTY